MTNDILLIKNGNIDDFKYIYADMTVQFPQSELKDYQVLYEKIVSGNYIYKEIYDDTKKVGYILYLLYKNHIWIDYIAFFKEFQSKGYGSKIFKQLKLLKNIQGCYLEVEKADRNNINTLRRIQFYEKQGAKRLPFEYLYPNKNTSLPMNLFYLPIKSNSLPDKNYTITVIKNIFDLLHNDLPEIKNIFDKICFTNNI